MHNDEVSTLYMLKQMFKFKKMLGKINELMTLIQMTRPF